MVAAFHAFDAAAELALEQVCYNRIVTLTEVLVPDLRLGIHRFLVAVDGFVLGLLRHAVELIVHAVKYDPKKLLGVLLSITVESPSYSANLAF